MVDKELERYASRYRRKEKLKKAQKDRKRKAAMHGRPFSQRSPSAAAGGGLATPDRAPPPDLRGATGRAELRVASRGVVSVLMTAYRAEKWIREAAASILNQKLPWGWRLELVIGVDACPTTLRTALDIADDSRVVVVNMSKNVGTYQTLNALLDHTRGSLIAVMDSDDVSTTRRLGAQVWGLVRKKAYSVVGGYYKNCDTAMKPLSAPTPKICHGAMMARRSLYDRLGGYKAWRCGADTDFLLRAQKVGARTLLFDETFLLRRVHPSSLCHAPATGMASELRATVFREREKERTRRRATVVKRDVAPHVVVRDARPNFDSANVGAILSTRPAREAQARVTLAALVAQGVNLVHVYLRGYSEVPDWAKGDRVKPTLAKRTAGGLARFATAPPARYVLSVDDRTVYPGDYVARSVAELRKAGPGTLVSHRARSLGVAPLLGGRTSVSCEAAAFHGEDLWALEAGAAPADFAEEEDVWLTAAAARIGLRVKVPESADDWLSGAPARRSERRRRAAVRAALRMGVWKGAALAVT